MAAAGFDGSSIATLDDMMTICKAAKAAGKNGFIYRGDSQNNLVVDFLPILLSFGGWVIDENNKPTVDSDEFKAPNTTTTTASPCAPVIIMRVRTRVTVNTSLSVRASA